MIDRATVDKIMDATNIVDVVGDFVTLRKAGVNYRGLCPFHDDKTPSFMVSPAKQICKCFACGEGGTAVNFLMKHEQITYPEALRWLAKKYNIEIHEKELTDEEKKEQSDRESMFIVNEWALDYFQGVLKNDPDGIAIGKQYFRSRGIRDDIIEKFQLGFALPRRDALATAAQKAGYKAEYLVKTGLCVQGEKGLHDRYAGRVIFPWLNVSGRVVAFGGRLLDARTKGVQQKYVNSPDSDIYHKERELYGLFHAKKAIAKEDRVFMVEGYTDVIAMHQSGIENVVANSGTALSQHQIKLLRRFTQNITLLYDGDEAGIHAAMRGTDMLLAEGMNLKVLLLPDGDDPDSFARKHSAQQLKDYIEENQTDFIAFKTRVTVENVNDPVKRSEAIGGIVKSISLIPENVLRDEYIHVLATRLQMNEKTLLDAMNKMINQHIEEKAKERERAQAQAETQTDDPEAPAAETPAPFIGLHTINEQTAQVERLLLQAIIRDGEKVIFENVETENGDKINLTVAQYIGYDLGQDGLTFHLPIYCQILDEALAHSSEKGFIAESYFMQHPDIHISQLATELAISRHQLGKGFQPKERENGLRQHVLHLVLDYRYYYLGAKEKELLSALKANKENYMETLKEYMRVKGLFDIVSKKLGRDVK